MVDSSAGLRDPAPVWVAARDLAAHLSSCLYEWTAERDLQDAVADRLGQRYAVCRERALPGRDRPDFLVETTGFGVAVEVKVNGSRTAVLRQLGRYAAHREVGAVVLASGRRSLLAGMPAMIHGKPVAVALLAGGL